MRGADDRSIGERVAFYRMRRGLTQTVLAGLVDRSADWLSKVERGERAIQRLDILSSLAEALRVPLGDLLGQPVLAETDDSSTDIPAIRDALMAPSRLSTLLFDTSDQPAPAVRHLRTLTERSWSSYQHGRLGHALSVLPQLITDARRLERHEPAGLERWAVSSRVHHLASTSLSKLGEADLAWIAAERALQAADAADNPLVLASAARSGTHALLTVGRYDAALTLGNQAHAWLRRRLRDRDPAAVSLLGSLDLRMSIAAARRQDRATATELLDRADAAARHLGADANHWQTAFGTTNVAVHRISAALDLGDIPYVITHGSNVDPSPLPAERRACHTVDQARAHSYHGHDDQAAELLMEAEATAPDLVRHNPAVRETARTLWRRNPGTLARRDTFIAFAARCRATP